MKVKNLSFHLPVIPVVNSVSIILSFRTNFFFLGIWHHKKQAGIDGLPKDVVTYTYGTFPVIIQM
jgi:hypothetical protein